MARILIVDPDEQVRKMCQSALAGAGHQVTAAPRPEAAMALCRAESFELVISDANTEGLSGHDLARWMAAEFPNRRVGLMSSSAPECERCPFVAGCPMLRKPFTLREMREFAASILGGHRRKIDWDWAG